MSQSKKAFEAAQQAVLVKTTGEITKLGLASNHRQSPLWV